MPDASKERTHLSPAFQPGISGVVGFVRLEAQGLVLKARAIGRTWKEEGSVLRHLGQTAGIIFEDLEHYHHSEIPQ